MQWNEVVEALKKQDIGRFLQKARVRGHICPCCGNGTGRDGDGIMLHAGHYKCFRCGKSGDLIDFIGYEFNLDDFADKVRKGAEIYGFRIDEDRSRSTWSVSKREPGVPETGPRKEMITNGDDRKVREYIEKCHQAAGQTDYFQKRGITKDSVEQFRLGYDPDFREGTGNRSWQAVIIPTSDVTYEARNVAVEPNSSEDGKNKYRKHGSATLFNGDALVEEKERPIFICEGAIDAISIIQSGGQAVGLGSAANYTLLLKKLESVKPAKPLVILLDSDQIGAASADKIKEVLEKGGIPYIQDDSILQGYHDPNNRLLKDAEGLKAAVRKVLDQVAAMPDPEELRKQEYISTSAGLSLSAFEAAIQASAKRPRLKTGFDKIDQALDGGIYTGLYIIGAISSLGKTTLALQIADNLAVQGRDVLFFSLEQSKYDLMSKSISRETFRVCWNRSDSDPRRLAKSNLGVLDGRRWEKYSDEELEVLGMAFNNYAGYADHIFLYEGIGNISVSDIRERVREHISITGNRRPVVFIDYQQILKASEGDERATDKQIVDHNVTALKQMSRDFDLPIVAVSSLNRQNYNERINMSAFKESGAIEYGSDVLIGLQLTGAGEAGFDATKEKSKDPRNVDFCVLKNRNGRVVPDGIPMHFWPVYNFFCTYTGPTEDAEWQDAIGEEDNIPFR